MPVLFPLMNLESCQGALRLCQRTNLAWHGNQVVEGNTLLRGVDEVSISLLSKVCSGSFSSCSALATICTDILGEWNDYYTAVCTKVGLGRDE